MSDPRHTRIGLLDAMGGGNLGDAAIQDAVIANIRKRLPDARIVGFSFAPEDTENRHGIPCHPLTRDWRPSPTASAPGADAARAQSGPGVKSALKKVRVLRALLRPLAEGVRECLFLARSYRAVRDLDLLIMSGGGQLCELWGGPWAHLYNLFKFSVLARLAGRCLCYLNVGAEPLEHRLSRFFAKSGIQLAQYVSFRDTYSQTVARDYGVKATTSVHPDPVYALELNFKRNGAGAASPTVGLNPLGFCDPRIWPRQEQAVYNRYLDKMTKFAQWLGEQGYVLKIFSTSAGVDHYAVDDLKQRLRQFANVTAVPSPAPAVNGPAEKLSGGVQQLLQEMSACDFIVTSRYHGVIFAHLLGKPVIALSYQGKSDAAMQAAGLEKFTAQVEHFEVDWLVDAFRSLVRDREAIAAREAGAVAANVARLQRQFDELFALSGPAWSGSSRN